MLCVPYVGVNMSVSVSVTEMSTVRHYLYGLHVCLSSNIPLWPISLIKFQAIMLVSLLSVASRGGAGNSESGRIKGGDPSCTRSQRSGIG
jgi:hypothetical protein